MAKNEIKNIVTFDIGKKQTSLENVYIECSLNAKLVGFQLLFVIISLTRIVRETISSDMGQVHCIVPRGT